MRTRLVVVALVIVPAITGCSREKDALSDAHDVAARVVKHDLTVAKLGTLLGTATIGVQLTPDNAVTVANIWSSYHRLAYAAAFGDSLESHISAAVTPLINRDRADVLQEILRRPLRRETATEAAYYAGARGLYAVRHILFAYPRNPTRLQIDSVRAVAKAVRPLITSSNFAMMARQYSSDKNSAAEGGDLGVISKATTTSVMAAVLEALEPDSVSSLVAMPLGVEVVQCLSWADAKRAYVPAFDAAVIHSNDSLVAERMARAVNLTVLDLGPLTARAAVVDPVKSSRDATVIATFNKGGKFTVADMLVQVNLMPAAQRLRVLTALPEASDSLATTLLRDLAIRAVLVRAADSARIDVPESQKAALRDLFRKDLVQTWRQLGVAPDQLTDSARTPLEREQLAARRVDRALERAFAGEIQLASIPWSVEAALDAKYETVISSIAISRAVDVGTGIRRVTDSLRSLRVIPSPPPR